MSLKGFFGALFRNNRSLKWISIGIGIISWFIVVGFISPDYTLTVRGVPISIDLENSATGQLGLKVVEGGDSTVDIVVKGKRYAVGNLTKDDFSAYGTINNVKDSGTYSISVTVTKKYASSDYQIQSSQPLFVMMKFDWIDTKEFTIETDVTGITPAGDYLLGTPSLSLSQVSVTGPRTEVRKIEKIVAKPTSGGEKTQDVSVETPILLFDESGNRVNSKNLTVSADKVTVTVPVLKSKSVGLKLNFVNVPSGFDTSLMRYTLSSDKLTIAGGEKLINDTTFIAIGEVDLSKVDLNSVFTIPITVPGGIRNLSNQFSVTASFSSQGLSKNYYKVTALSLKNVPAGITATMLTKTVYSVAVIGSSDVMSTLTGNDLIAQADLNGIELKNGNNTVPLMISAPGKGLVWAFGNYSAIIRVVK